jgi:hypothetical protein
LIGRKTSRNNWCVLILSISLQLFYFGQNDPEDPIFFQQWAIYKGRYAQNPDGSFPPEDYTNWKANFRCAMNRCNDIEQIDKARDKDPGNKDLKTYKFFPRLYERGNRLVCLWSAAAVLCQFGTTKYKPMHHKFTNRDPTWAWSETKWNLTRYSWCKNKLPPWPSLKFIGRYSLRLPPCIRAYM